LEPSPKRKTFLINDDSSDDDQYDDDNEFEDDKQIQNNAGKNVAGNKG
jgi:hypothetical protein